MFKNYLMIAIKAFIVGSTMVVPGVSGGSMAMILGEYDRLISAIPEFFNKKTFKKSFIYLCVFGIAGVLGIVLMATPLTILLDKYYQIVMYFFMGAVAGTIPMIFKKARQSRVNVLSIIYIVAGILCVNAISFIPEGAIHPSLEMSFTSLAFQLFAGVLVSIGFILPGISTSYLLVVLGLYEPILTCLSELNIFPLIPLAIGMIGGVIGLTGLLKWAMERHPSITYMMILGFLLGSIVQVFPGVPKGISLLFSFIFFIVGTLIIYKLSKLEE